MEADATSSNRFDRVLFCRTCGCQEFIASLEPDGSELLHPTHLSSGCRAHSNCREFHR